MTRTGESGLMSPWTGASASPIKTEFNRLSSWRNKLYKRSARQIASWTPREHLFFFRPKEGLGEEKASYLHILCTRTSATLVKSSIILHRYALSISFYPTVREPGAAHARVQPRADLDMVAKCQRLPDASLIPRCFSDPGILVAMEIAYEIWHRKSVEPRSRRRRLRRFLLRYQRS